MEVSCAKCPARYAVPDEKVRGRKVRIQCKRCKAPIVVDGSSLEPQSAGAPAAAAAAAQGAAAQSKPDAKARTAVAGSAAEAASGPPRAEAASAARAAPLGDKQQPAPLPPPRAEMKTSAQVPRPKDDDKDSGKPKQLEAPGRPRMDSGWREPGALAGPKVPGAGLGARGRSPMKRTMIGGLGGPGMDDDAFSGGSSEDAEPAPPPPAPEPEPSLQPSPIASPPRPGAVGAAPRARAAIKKTMIGIPAPAAAPPEPEPEPEASLPPIAEVEPAPQPPRPGTAAEWTVAITDEQHEELTTSEVVELYVRGGVDAETFIWAEGMEDWKVPWEIPVLAAELRRRGLVPPEEGAQIIPSDDFGEDEHTVIAQGPGSWREPGGWDALPGAAESDIGFEDVTVSMDAPSAVLLMRQASQPDDDDGDDDTMDADVDALLDAAEPAATPYAGYTPSPAADYPSDFADDSYDVTDQMIRPAQAGGVYQLGDRQGHAPIQDGDILDFHMPPAPPPVDYGAAPVASAPQAPSAPVPVPPMAFDPRLVSQHPPPATQPPQAEQKRSGGGWFIFVIVVILLLSAVAVSYVTRQPAQLWDRIPL